MLCYVMLCYVVYYLLAIEMSQIKMNIQTPMVGYFNPSVEGSQDVREPKSLEELIEVGFKVWIVFERDWKVFMEFVPWT